MNTRQLIKHLSTRNGLIISLYLPVNPGESKKTFLSRTHSHLQTLRHSIENLNKEIEKYLNSLLSKIEHYLSNFDSRGTKTLVIFAGRNFYKGLKLPLTIPYKAAIQKRPLLTPLTKVLDENPPFLLVLIDRTAGKIIEVNLLQPEAISTVIKSDVPQRILARGDNMGREDKILRHIEEHLRAHLEKIAKVVRKFEKNYPDGFIVLGTQKELIGKFKRLLPNNLQNKIIGNFGAEFDDNETKLIEKAQRLVDEYLENQAWKKARV